MKWHQNSEDSTPRAWFCNWKHICFLANQPTTWLHDLGKKRPVRFWTSEESGQVLDGFGGWSIRSSIIHQHENPETSHGQYSMKGVQSLRSGSFSGGLWHWWSSLIFWLQGQSWQFQIQWPLERPRSLTMVHPHLDVSIMADEAMISLMGVSCSQVMSKPLA